MRDPSSRYERLIPAILIVLSLAALAMVVVALYVILTA